MGATIQLNWDVSDLSFNYFLYLKKSHKSSKKDKKWKRIDEKGVAEIIVTDKDFECQLRKFTLLGWKTLGVYQPEVRVLDVQTPLAAIDIPEIAFKRKPSIALNGFLPKFKNPGMRMFLPSLPVIDYSQGNSNTPEIQDEKPIIK